MENLSNEIPAPTELEKRRLRYLANLDALQMSDMEKIYPAEMKKREWSEITDGAEIEKFRPKPLIVMNQIISKGLYGVFRDKNGEHTFIAPRLGKYSKIREILLDMLATAKEIAPWASAKGIGRTDDKMFEGDCGIWTFTGTIVQYHPNSLENMVNGVGDDKYSVENKQGFLREHVAAIVHENLHIHNEQDLNMGGPARTITETAPIMGEYLAFPDKNGKMKSLVQEAIQTLEQKQTGKRDLYVDATLLGIIVAASCDGTLPETENLASIKEALENWQKRVENLPPKELTVYRRKIEQEWLLSLNDEKLKSKLTELKQTHPQLIENLLENFVW